jgi:hypothetical protein
MLIASPDLLRDPSVPEGVKMYFRDYAKETMLLGQVVLIISQRLHWNHEDHAAFFRREKGVGPSHTINHIEYDKLTPEREDKREGVKPRKFYNVGISAWMREHELAGGKLVAHLNEVGERHDSSFFSDD